MICNPSLEIQFLNLKKKKKKGFIDSTIKDLIALTKLPWSDILSNLTEYKVTVTIRLNYIVLYGEDRPQVVPHELICRVKPIIGG